MFQVKMRDVETAKQESLDLFARSFSEEKRTASAAECFLNACRRFDSYEEQKEFTVAFLTDAAEILCAADLPTAKEREDLNRMFGELYCAGRERFSAEVFRMIASRKEAEKT